MLSHRLLATGVQRFVLVEGLVDGCMACDAIGIALTYLEIGPNEGDLLIRRPIGLVGEKVALEFDGRIREGMTGWEAVPFASNSLILQYRLNMLGYEAGEMDGYAGPQTREALMAFQVEHCLAPTGQPDAATVRALGAAEGLRAPCAGAGVPAKITSNDPLLPGIYVSDPSLCKEASIDAAIALDAQRIVRPGLFNPHAESACIPRRADIRNGRTLFRGSCSEGISSSNETSWTLDVETNASFQEIDPGTGTAGPRFALCPADSPLRRGYASWFDGPSAVEPAAPQARYLQPGRGDPARSAILSAMRPVAETVFGAPVEFIDVEMRVNGGLAYADVFAQRPGGSDIDPRATPDPTRAADHDNGFDWNKVSALLRRDAFGSWQVERHVIAASEAFWLDDCATWGPLFPETCGASAAASASGGAFAAPAGSAWLQTHSREDRGEAIAIAVALRAREPRARVFRAANGWYAVIARAVPRAEVESLPSIIRASGLPFDSVLVGGATFTEAVPLDANAAEVRSADRPDAGTENWIGKWSGTHRCGVGDDETGTVTWEIIDLGGSAIKIHEVGRGTNVVALDTYSGTLDGNSIQGSSNSGTIQGRLTSASTAMGEASGPWTGYRPCNEVSLRKVDEATNIATSPAAVDDAIPNASAARLGGKGAVALADMTAAQIAGMLRAHGAAPDKIVPAGAIAEADIAAFEAAYRATSPTIATPDLPIDAGAFDPQMESLSACASTSLVFPEDQFQGGFNGPALRMVATEQASGLPRVCGLGNLNAIARLEALHGTAASAHYARNNYGPEPMAFRMDAADAERLIAASAAGTARIAYTCTMVFRTHQRPRPSPYDHDHIGTCERTGAVLSILDYDARGVDRIQFAAVPGGFEATGAFERSAMAGSVTAELAAAAEPLTRAPRSFETAETGEAAIRRIVEGLVGGPAEVVLGYRNAFPFKSEPSKVLAVSVFGALPQDEVSTVAGTETGYGSFALKSWSDLNRLYFADDPEPGLASAILGQIEDLRIMSLREIVGSACEWSVTYRIWLSDLTPFGTALASVSTVDGDTFTACFRTTRDGYDVVSLEHAD